MTKISEISESSVRPASCLFFGAMITLVISIFVFQVAPFEYKDYIEGQSKFSEIIGLIPATFIIMVTHELIHGVFFLFFGKGRARIRIRREKGFGAIIVHQVNENVFYGRPEIVMVLLAPFVILTGTLMSARYFVDAPFMLYGALVLNTFGSAIDFYISFVLFTKYRPDILINFNSEKVVMNIYQNTHLN